jgi:hypothetical protein
MGKSLQVSDCFLVFIAKIIRGTKIYDLLLLTKRNVCKIDLTFEKAHVTIENRMP